MKSMQLTVWGEGNEPLESQYGSVAYMDWCRLEAERIGRAYVMHNGSPTRVAVFTGALPKGALKAKVLHNVNRRN